LLIMLITLIAANTC